MSKALEYIGYLSQEIGPRPAGTEEEQQAALYLADTLNENTNLNATIEDFTGASGSDLPVLVCALVSVVFGALGMFVPILAIPGIILTAAAAVVLVLEYRGKAIISRLQKKGISQNVVAKYEPQTAEGSRARKRKVIVVARYDSGKVRPELKGNLLGLYPVLMKVGLVGTIALPILLLIRNTLFKYSEGFFVVLITVLVVLMIVCAAIPLVFILLRKTSNYNEAANSNAAGAAVMLEVASRLGGREGEVLGMGTAARGAEYAAGGGFAPVLHGEQAARDAGLVPEGAELLYNYSAGDAGAEFIEEADEGLVAAKAAIAALTGKSINTAPAKYARPIEMAEQGEETSPVPAESEAFEEAAVVSAGLAAGEAELGAAEEAKEEANQNVPSWFTAAKAKARKSEREVEIQPSVYGTALDRANAIIAMENRRAEEAEQEEAAAEEAAMPAAAVVEDQVEVGAVDNASEKLDTAQPVMGEAADEEASAVAQVAETQQAEAEVAISDVADVEEQLTDTSEAAGEVEVFDEIEAEPEQKEEAQPQFVLPAEGLIATPISGNQDAARGMLAGTGTMAPIGANGQQYAPLASDGGVSGVRGISVLPTFDVPSGAGVASIPLRSTQSNGGQQGALTGLPGFNLPSIGGGAPAGAVPAVPMPAPVPALDPVSNGVATGAIPPAIPAMDFPQVPAPMPIPAPIPAPAPVPAPMPVPGPAPVQIDNYAGSPGSTSAFAPVSQDLVRQASSPDDLYVDDVDDAAFAENYTNSGAPAGPDYIGMPKKRGLFGRIRKDKKRNEVSTSAQEWLDVADDFDAQSVGRERGGWESFNTDNATDAQEYGAPQTGDTQYMDMRAMPAPAPEELGWANAQNAGAQNQTPQLQMWDDSWSGKGAWGKEDDWHGGAFSRKKDKGDNPDQGVKEKRFGKKGKKAGRKGAVAPEDDFAYESDSVAESYEADEGAYYDDVYDSRDSYDTYGADDAYAGEGGYGNIYGANVDEGARGRSEAMDIIENFREIDLDTEVWFVALGSELGTHAGIKAFLKEHGSELRGALFVELDSLGAGELSVVNKEGLMKQVENSTRMLRHVKRASQATGVPCGNVNLPYIGGTSAYVSEQGYQTIHLAGIRGGKQAFFAQADDVIENIDEEALFENTAFVLEMLRGM